MNKLLQLVVLAIAAIAGFKRTIASLQEHNNTLSSENTDLRNRLDADQANDADLRRRADEAEARRAELEGQLKDADARAEELARALEDEPSVPTVDARTFETTAPPSANLQDLAFRENQAETSGVVTPNPAPAVRNNPDTSNTADTQDPANEGNKQPEGGAKA